MHMSPNRVSYLEKRFGNTLLASQILLLASALNAYLLSGDFVGQHQIPFIFSIRLDIVMLSMCSVLVIPIIKTIKNLEKATICYFWMAVILTSILAVLQGGLQSVPVLFFPVIAIFSALHLQRNMFLSICAFYSFMVIIIGANDNYGWFHGVLTSGTARIIDSLVLLLLSSYVALILGEDAKRSMAKLEKEHQNTIESKKLIQHLADTDSLTGLANRDFAKTRFEAMQSELDVANEEIGLYFVDLDNFKTINDLFDHQVGDELLKVVAKRLSSLVDSNGIVCRLGGDEFVLFVKVSSPFDFDTLAKDILISLSEPHEIFGAQAGITASIGITVINDRNINFDNTRKQADMAMYKSKQAGKNDYHYYSKDLKRDYMRSLTILDALKDALRKNLFDLHFQPKVDIKSSQVIGAEALLRWNRENPDKLTPDVFIPIIESTELIHSIGEWVIQQACHECKRWHQNGHHMTIAVNVSALQLVRADFYDIVVDSLEASGLPASYLEIELTEHFMIQENTIIQSQLSALKKLGVKLAIDDFGTGYSNMGYLTRMEIDTLKLDKSFISEIENSKDSLAIVTAIHGMADVLGMNVVAEGVEKESERKLLAGMGCNIGQGFLWSKALPGSHLLDSLSKSEIAMSLA